MIDPVIDLIYPAHRFIKAVKVSSSRYICILGDSCQRLGFVIPSIHYVVQRDIEPSLQKAFFKAREAGDGTAHTASEPGETVKYAHAEFQYVSQRHMPFNRDDCTRQRYFDQLGGLFRHIVAI